VTEAVTPEPPISHEPGFVVLDLFHTPYFLRLPERTPGLLAFLHVEKGKEKVVGLVLLEDLAKEFAQSGPFCGHANVADYYPFPHSKNSGWKKHRRDLEEKLQLYARLTEKYKAPQ
jgi:hypothetical protein